MFIKISLLVVFFEVMIGVGVYARKSARDVNGFVLGVVLLGHGLLLLHMAHPIFRL